mmetsp:Transcript_21111/g.58458  ORF Transcript_21111/g.58458 Transcript_21111/m.58458 type:complete len:366 (+) Transcript_21111:3-1100(+)
MMVAADAAAAGVDSDHSNDGNNIKPRKTQIRMRSKVQMPLTQTNPPTEKPMHKHNNNNNANSTIQGGDVVEATLNFRVLSPEEFAAQAERPDESQEQTTDDNHSDEDEDLLEMDDEGNVIIDDDDASDDDDSDNEKENDLGGIWDLMGGGGDSDDDDEEPAEHREPRAFLQLWKALAQWVTPEAVDYYQALRRHDSLTMMDKDHHGNNVIIAQQQRPSWNNDIERSRCAGLMSLLQLYLPACWRDDWEFDNDDERPQHQPPTVERKQVEQRLAQWIRTFSFAREAPKLDGLHARALTCLFLHMVVVVVPEESTNNKTTTTKENQMATSVEEPTVPPSCRAVGLTWEEYRHLVESAIPSFQKPAWT